MPVLDQVRDDGSGIQNLSNLLDSGFRQNDDKAEELTFYEFINFEPKTFSKISAFCSFFQGCVRIQHGDPVASVAL